MLFVDDFGLNEPESNVKGFQVQSEGCKGLQSFSTEVKGKLCDSQFNSIKISSKYVICLRNLDSNKSLIYGNDYNYSFTQNQNESSRDSTIFQEASDESKEEEKSEFPDLSFSQI